MTTNGNWASSFGLEPSDEPRGGIDRELRGRVVDADDTFSSEPRAAELWSAIRLGELLVVDSFSTDARAYLVMQWRTGDVSPARVRNWEVLERILLGDSQKIVGIELQLGPSSVAAMSKSALRAIGVTTRVSQAPPLLYILAHASARHGTTPFRESRFEFHRSRYCCVSMSLQSPALAERLSPAEQDVALMRIAGRSLSEIAASRNTSRRTVANQLCAAFRRLGVSGRSSLVEYFLFAPGAPPSSSVHRKVAEAEPQLTCSRPTLDDFDGTRETETPELLANPKHVEVELLRRDPERSEQILDVDPAAGGGRMPQALVFEPVPRQRQQQVVVRPRAQRKSAILHQHGGFDVFLVERHS